MDRRLATILQTFSLTMLAWFAYSWFGKVHWILGAILCGFTLLNVLTTWGLREQWPVCRRAIRVPLGRTYVGFVCNCTGQQIPIDSSEESCSGLRLCSKQDFDMASKQAKQIIRGHDEAIARALARVQENVTLRKRHRRGTVHGPLASFLLVGPEGVGKRYFARVLAKLLYGDKAIDIFECDQTSASDLVGAKGAKGELETVRRSPHRMLLFEHADRAPTAVVRILTKLLSSSTLQVSGADNEMSFENTIVMLTVSTPASDTGSSHEVGLDQQAERLVGTTELDNQLLNAVTEPMYFAAPDDRVKSEVVTQLMINECRAYHLELVHVDPEVIATQVLWLHDKQGFAGAPQRVKKFLRKPLVAAAEGQHKSLSLRVR